MEKSINILTKQKQMQKQFYSQVELIQQKWGGMFTKTPLPNYSEKNHFSYFNSLTLETIHVEIDSRGNNSVMSSSHSGG